MINTYCIEEYKENTRAELTQEINQKIKIYLDTKYWIEICNHIQKNEENNAISRIYNLLKEGVKSNKIICPISYRIFIEIMKQTDIESLSITAKIIDELSMGYMIRKENELLEHEVYTFLLSTLKITTTIENATFTFLSLLDIYGIHLPYSDIFSQQENFILQKTFIDEERNKSLVGIVNKIDTKEQTIFNNHIMDIEAFNVNKKLHNKNYNTLHQLYMIEITGSIEQYMDVVKSAFKKFILKKAELEKIDLSTDKVNTSIIPILNMLKYFLDKNIENTELPSLDIPSMLHAKIRWNTTQKYKKGDFNDIWHTSLALPHYDYFFTERSLHNMIKECKYDEKYNCKVVSNNNEIMTIIESINQVNIDKPQPKTTLTKEN